MPPESPIDIPAEAYAALESLRAGFAPYLPEGSEFGIGAKQTGGEYLDQLSLIVFVPRKLPIEEVPEEQRIPVEWSAGGITLPTDVIESNPKQIALVNDSSYAAVLTGGIEIGWEEPEGVGVVHVHTGTLGCIAQRRIDGQRQLLTAQHVAALGRDMNQPASGAIIGTASREGQYWDCSVIDDNGSRGVPQPTVKEIGSVKGSAPHQVWGPAKKRGRTTGLTSGLVVAVVLDATGVVLRIILATFPFGGLYCYHGDSGSAILNGQDEVIGLLVEMDEEVYDAAHNPVSSVGRAVPIQAVLDDLEIEIAVSPPVITRIDPDTGIGVLGGGGWAQIDGWGFDAGSQVTFDGMPAISVTPASPRRLIVLPPIHFPGTAASVIVTNSHNEQSLPGTAATFYY
jgi:hypothetical protein